MLLMISSGGRGDRGGRVRFAVLVKPVPDVARAQYDPAGRMMVRQGVPLFVNPFDQRALQVALDLRRPGERVSVLAMGPPGAARCLRECLALGADEAFLVTDPALSGSDTLVTARVLARALGQRGHDLVLGGWWSTDSETGQVGPEVAALLGVDVLTGALRLARGAEDDAFELLAETSRGTRRFRFRPPAVVTVGEKIVKIRKAAVEAVDAVPDARVVRITLSELGLGPGAAGVLGSPTVVESVVDDAPVRHPLLLTDGPVELRVQAAIDRLSEILARPPPPLPEVPPLPLEFRDEREVLVLVTEADGGISPHAVALLEQVRRELPGHWPSPVWVGSAPGSDASLRLAEAGGWRGYRIETGGRPLTSRGVALALGPLLSDRPRAAAFVLPASPFGREVAGQVAARASLGLVGDAIAMRLGGDGRIRWGKPSFGGGRIAWIVSRSHPDLATVRAPPVAVPSAPSRRGLPVEWLARDASLPSDAIEVGEETVDPDDGFGDLASAPVVLAVGMGLGGPEHLAGLRPTLRRWGAALAATRRVVDAGWVARRRQVGLTGTSLAPELAVLLGVSGSPHHLVGWRRARAILAVDAEARAAVFLGADVGLVGRWEEILPRLDAPLSAWLKGRRAASR